LNLIAVSLSFDNTNNANNSVLITFMVINSHFAPASEIQKSESLHSFSTRTSTLASPFTRSANCFTLSRLPRWVTRGVGIRTYDDDCLVGEGVGGVGEGEEEGEEGGGEGAEEGQLCRGVMARV
jgi:hypothetical protein